MPQIKLSGQTGAGKYATVDIEDYDRLMNHSWYEREGYALSKINGRETRMHRLIMNATDPLVVVDHKNRDRLDNRRANLRLFTHTQNANNRGTNVFVECFGESRTIAEWSRDERCIVSYDALQKRLQDGVEAWAAILAPGESDSTGAT